MIINGNSLEELKKFPDNYFHSVVTDPPYGLSFMGKKWDYDVPSVEIWQEVFRVLKEGGYLLSFAGTRTQHRMAVNIEDAGFEIRDMIAWVYGSGFPKSHNIGKAVDKFGGRILGKEVGKIIKEKRKELGYSTIQLAEIGKFYGKKNHGGTVSNWETGNGNITPEQFNSLIKILNLKDNPIIENKRQFIKKDKNWGKKGNIPLSAYKDFDVTKGNSEWEGWGTALKPALEPITMARKPFKTNVAENVLKNGVGGINIDECRVSATKEDMGDWDRFKGHQNSNTIRKNMVENKTKDFTERVDNGINNKGRFPANFIHDGSDEVKDLLEESSRFFYCAKASKQDRNEGCENLEEKETKRYNDFEGTEKHAPKKNVKNTNNHPTVKPTDLMRYLVRLVTPKNGIVLDCFMGSGSTGKACALEGFEFVGIDLDKDYCKIAKARIDKALEDKKQAESQTKLF